MGFLLKFVLAIFPLGSHRQEDFHNRDSTRSLACMTWSMPVLSVMCAVYPLGYIVLVCFNPSQRASWEALHTGRAVAEPACVFKGSVTSEVLLIAILETGN